MTRNFLVGQDDGLADVLVSIVNGLDRRSYSAPLTNLEIAFVNCQIQPHVIAGMIGQKWTVKNADAPRHTLQISKINKSPFLSIPLPPNSPNSRFASLNVVPTRLAPHDAWLGSEGFLRIKCEDHPWEHAFLSLFDHPFFAVTDTNGNFVIGNVPPGEYSLQAIHPAIHGTNSITRDATVRRDQVSQVHFTLDAPGN